MGVGDCICGATSASGQAAACCGIAVLLSACRPTLLPTAAAAGREEEARRQDYCPVDPPQCLWSLEEDVDGQGERCKLLVLTLARPDPTEEEVTWKKGEAPELGP